MFDTHAHVHDKAFDPDREAVLERAREAGVERILTIGTDLATSHDAREIAVRYGLDYAIGIHPHEAKDAPADLAGAFDAFIAASPKPPRAIGEMGLDYYYDHSPREVQRDVLAKGIRYARKRGFPAVFHERDAFVDFVEVLRAEAPQGLRGVVHCFTGDTAAARLLVDEFGLYLGIGGVVTFKNAQGLRDAVAAVGLEHVILETDAPYLAPVPHRGRRNEPAFVAATAAVVAGLFATSVKTVAAKTNASAIGLFGPRTP
jgi:TatD DNase family protein